MTTAAEVFKPLVVKLQGRAPDYVTAHEYWMAENDLPIETVEFQSRFGTLFSDFRDNLARPIIKSAESRVRITGFGNGEGIGKLADDLWDANKMSIRHQHVHTEAMVKGDAYVLVMPKADKTPGIYAQVSETCVILYDDIDPDEKVAALKHWVAYDAKDQPFVRVNLYFPDRVERYISKRSSTALTVDFEKDFQPYGDDGDWMTKHKVGQVPMFEFNANYDLTTDRGRSDLADAMGFIDAINKTFLDMMTASEFTAAPQRYATGVEIALDPKTGEPLEAYKQGKNKLWTAPNEGAKFGQFTAGDLSSYRDAVDSLVDHLSFNSATPSYSLMKTAQYPSGEALRSAEGPLRGRVSDHQDAFGPVWADIMEAALTLDGAAVPALRSDFSPTWLPVNAPFATKELMEELKIKAETLGVPEEMLWIEAGYSADQIALMKEMREEEATLGPDPLDLQAAAILAGAPQAEAEAGGVVNDGTVVAESAGE